MTDEEYRDLVTKKVQLEYENQQKLSVLIDMITKLMTLELKEKENIDE